MAEVWQALSIKQPWAALIVHGVKTIEVRTWLTGKRGPILIHASKSPEPNADAWKLVSSPQLMETAGLVGGIIGMAELCECITYSSREAYAIDGEKHRTTAERFQPPVMYGFRFRQAKPVNFVPWLGNTNFFAVEAEIVPRRKPRAKRPPAKAVVVRLPEDGPR